MPAPLNRNNRDVRPGRRFWNGHEVDANLRDEWLERLNKLANFRLTSICEGHASERRGFGGNPHLILRLMENHNPLMISSWHEIRTALYGKFPCCNADTRYRVNFELSSDVRLSRGVLQPPVDRFLIRIDSTAHRETNEPETWFDEFFEQSVQFAETADSFLREILDKQRIELIKAGKFVSGAYLKFRYGADCPAVLVDAVHAAKPRSDAYTGKIVEAVAKSCSCHAIISTISRQIADINRPPIEENAGAVEEYRRTIQHLFESGRLLLSDRTLSRPILHIAVHGMKDSNDADIELGTRMGSSCSADVLDWVHREIDEWAASTPSLVRKPVLVENRRFIGDASKQFHRRGGRRSSYRGYGDFFNTIQIEFAYWLRNEHRAEIVNLLSGLAVKYQAQHEKSR